MLKTFEVQQDRDTQKWRFIAYRNGKVEHKSEPLFPDEEAAEQAAMKWTVDRMTTRLRILDLPHHIRQKLREIMTRRWDQESSSTGKGNPPATPDR